MEEVVETMTALNGRIESEISHVLDGLSWHIFMGQEVLSAAEVALLTNWSIKTLRRKTTKYSIPVSQIGGRNYYPKESVRLILFELYNLKG